MCDQLRHALLLYFLTKTCPPQHKPTPVNSHFFSTYCVFCGLLCICSSRSRRSHFSNIPRTPVFQPILILEHLIILPIGLLPILALLTNCPGCKYIFLSIRITPACCKYYAFCKYSSACCKYYAAFCKYFSACCNYLCLFINSDYQMCKETKEATQEEPPDCYLECEDS